MTSSIASLTTLDPQSVHPTPEGLQQLLQCLDQNCPLTLQQVQHYQASQYLRAGSTLELALPPIELVGSTVEWSVTLDDVHSERLDVNFGIHVRTNEEEEMVVVRETARILAPQDETDCSARGTFTVASGTPVTVMLQFDNSYSWLTPKQVSYCVTVRPPAPSEEERERSQRAESTCQRIQDVRRQMGDKLEVERRQLQSLDARKQDLQKHLDEWRQKTVDEKESVEALRRRAQEAKKELETKEKEVEDGMHVVQRETVKMEKCTQQIADLEQECARLKQKWTELKLERKERQDKKTVLSKRVEEGQEQCRQLQQEISDLTQQEQYKEEKVLVTMERDQALVRDNLNDLELERSIRKDEEKRYMELLKFYEMLEEAVKLRIIVEESKPDK